MQISLASFNLYELRARIIPALVVGSPLAIIAWQYRSFLADSGIDVLSGSLILLILLYLFSFGVREMGRSSESIIWNESGGAPSTRFCRWNDSQFGSDFKQLVHNAVKTQWNIELCPRDTETIDPKLADSKISQAFTLVRALLYQQDKDGIWANHNAEYGLLRNIVGSRLFWLILSILSVITGYFQTLNSPGVTFGIVLGLGSTLLSLVLGFIVFPRLVRIAGERYASSAWSAFVVLVFSRLADDKAS